MSLEYRVLTAIEGVRAAGLDGDRLVIGEDEQRLVCRPA